MRIVLSLLFFAASLIVPRCAFGSTLDTFLLSGNRLDMSFAVSSSPQPEGSDPTLGFFLDPVKLVANGDNYTARPADFFVGEVGGGFALQG